MFRLAPGGSGGAATAGLGKRSAARAALTLCRVISSRPTSAPAPAVTTATPLAARNRRRSGPREAPGSSGLGRKVNEDPPAGAAPGQASRVARACGDAGSEPGLGGALSPAGASRWRAEPGAAASGRTVSLAPPLRGRRSSPRAARTRRVSAKAPAAAPTSVGITYSTVAVGRVSAAARPMQANTARPASAEGEPPDGQDPDHRRERGQDHQDARQQRVLVVGAERRDGEVLDRQRREVDGRLPYRHHRRALRHGQAGRELADAHRDRRGEYPGGRPGERARLRRPVGGGQWCHGRIRR